MPDLAARWSSSTLFNSTEASIVAVRARVGNGRCEILGRSLANPHLKMFCNCTLTVARFFEPPNLVADFRSLFVILAFDRFFHVAPQLDQTRLGISRYCRPFRVFSVMAGGVVDVDQQRLQLRFEVRVVVGTTE